MGVESANTPKRKSTSQFFPKRNTEQMSITEKIFKYTPIILLVVIFLCLFYSEFSECKLLADLPVVAYEPGIRVLG
jgi:hypothetical protein